MAVLAEAFVRIRADAAGLGGDIRKELAGQSAAAGSAGAKTGESFVSGMGGKVNKIAGMISKAFIGGAVLVAGASVKMAVSFDSAMEKIVTQAGVSQAKLKGLETGVENLAGQVGFSPDSLAVSLYHVESNFASMGITSAKALAIVKVAAEGAATGGASLEDVTNALTAAVASGIPGVQNMSQAMGALNAIVGAGDMKMQDLAEAFASGMVVTVKGFGLSLRDVGAALDVFGDNNIRGAHAATMLRMAVMALAAPTKAGTMLLESIGIKAGQLAQDMKTGGLLKAMDDLTSHMKAAGIGAKEQALFITQAFGKKQAVGVSVLADQMERLRSKYPALAKGASSFGEAWKRTQATAAQQFKELIASAEGLAVKIGNVLLPYVMSLFNFIKDHTQVILIVTGAIGGLAVVIKTVTGLMKLWEAAQVVWAAITDTTTVSVIAVWLLEQGVVESAAAATIIATGGIVLILAALAIGVMEIIKHWRDFKQWGIDAFHAVMGAAKDVWNWIKSTWSGIVAAVEGPVTTVVNFVREHWKLLLALILGPLGLIIDAITTHWKTIEKLFSDAITFIKHLFDGAVKWLVKPGIDMLTGLWNGIASVVTWLYNHIKAEIVAIIKPWVTALTWLVRYGKDFLTGLWNGISAVVSWLTGRLMWLINTIVKSPFGKAISWLVTAGKNILQGLWNGMVSGVSSAASWVKNIGTTILNAVTSFFGIHSPSTVFMGIGKNLISGLFQGMVGGAAGLAKWVVSQIKNIGGSLWHGLLGILGIGGNSGSSGGGGTANLTGNKKIMNQAAAAMGWGSGAEWAALNNVEMAEAGYNNTAQNPTSTAYGMGQFLDTTWAGYGPKTSNPALQAKYMMEYIKGRYGDPEQAWAHEQQYHWYDRGGWLPPGLSLAMNATGQHERVSPPGSSGGMPTFDQMERLIAAVGASSVQTGAVMGSALSGTARNIRQRGPYNTRPMPMRAGF